MTNNLFKIENIKAMVVDDHDPIRKAMKNVLVKMGIKHIIECFDGVDALKALNKEHIDIVLLDLFMRRVDGFKVLQTIRQRSFASDIPVIVVTGETEKENIVKASALGASDYILKPFQADAMLQKVQLVLNNFFSPSALLKALRAADRLMIEGEYLSALKLYEHGLSIDPTSIRAKHSIAVALDSSGKKEEAIRQLEQNIGQSSSYYKNYQTLANIYIREGDKSQAIEAMTKELELNPKQPGRQIQLARSLMEKGAYQDAIEHLKEALKEEAKNKTAILAMGKAHAKIEDLEKAVYYFKRARRYHPKEPSILKEMVDCCIEAQQPKLAETTLREERSSHPERLDVHVELSRFYLLQNQIEDAEKILHDLLKVDPENSEGLKIKAQIFYKKKSFQEAYDLFSQVSKIEPSPDILLSQAICLVQLNKLKEAIDTIHKILMMNPKHGQAFFVLASIYKQSKQFFKAELCFYKSMKLGWNKNKCILEIKDCQKFIVQRKKIQVTSSIIIP